MTFGELMESYALRKRWETELLASQIVLQLGKALGGGAGRETALKRTSADRLLRDIGVEIK